MERKYKDTKTSTTRLGRKQTYSTLRKGLKIVHIGEDVWKVGRTKEVPNPDIETEGYPKTIAHCVIYGPERKEFHVWGNDTKKLLLEFEPCYDGDFGLPIESHCNRDGNCTNEAAVKVYILTSILDKAENWCFDLKKIPPVGKLKVIYHTGTIKNIDFDGEFKPVEVQYHSYYNEVLQWQAKQGDSKKKIKPIGYRIV